MLIILHVSIMKLNWIRLLFQQKTQHNTNKQKMYGKVLRLSLESLARISSNLTECNSVIVQQPENQVVHSLILLFPNIDFQVVPINY